MPGGTDRAKRAGAGSDPLAALDDTGRQLIDEVHSLLQIDEQWTEWHPDGFTWWAHGLAQTFRVEGPEDVDDIPTYWYSYETSVLKGLPVEHPKALTFVALQNRVNNLFTARVVGDRLVYSGRTYVLPESATDRARQIGHRAIIANALAHAQADQLSEMYKRFEPTMAGVEVDRTAHPSGGERPVPDDMLNVIDQSFKRLGVVPAPMERVGDLEQWASTFEARGLTARVLENGTTLNVANPHGSVPYLLHVKAAVSHPALGFGMLVRLSIPLLDSAIEASELDAYVARLNDLELNAKRPLVSLGSWVPDAQRRADGEPPVPQVTYATFYPNGLVGPGVAFGAVVEAGQRVEWCEEQSL